MRGHQSRCHCERMSKSVGAREGVSACKRGVFVGASDSIIGGLSLSDESFPNEGARGAFAKPSRSLQEGSAKPSRSVSSRRLRGASKAQPRTLRGGLRTLRGGCTYRRLHEDALEGSRGLLEGSVNELRVPTRSWL